MKQIQQVICSSYIVMQHKVKDVEKHGSYRNCTLLDQTKDNPNTKRILVQFWVEDWSLTLQIITIGSLTLQLYERIRTVTLPLPIIFKRMKSIKTSNEINQNPKGLQLRELTKTEHG